ncbi:MAG: hypothetical protein PHR35_20570 [Kiritimatiellae bacterium]|nr:hypothetical protein [Kiritimatiellia bacterium]
MSFLTRMFSHPPIEASKLRAWANANFKPHVRPTDANLPLVTQLSTTVIWCITRFGDRSANPRFPAQYAGDLAVFEWATYAYCELAWWHSDHSGIHPEQDSILKYLCRDFVDRFETETGITCVRDVITARIDLYTDLAARGKTGSIPFHIEQLILKSTEDHNIQPYNPDEPLIVGDFLVSQQIRSSLNAAKQNMIPAMLEAVHDFYQMVAPGHQLLP